MCGDGFEAARAYGKGAAGGDAAVYQEKEKGMITSPFFLFVLIMCLEGFNWKSKNETL